jgi:transcriptional regulator with XRE-family HTH domain
MNAEQFRAVLKTAGLKQKDLAARLGIEAITVNRWATDKAPVPQYAVAYLNLLRDAAAFYDGYDDKPRPPEPVLEEEVTVRDFTLNAAGVSYSLEMFYLETFFEALPPDRRVSIDDFDCYPSRAEDGGYNIEICAKTKRAVDVVRRWDAELLKKPQPRRVADGAFEVLTTPTLQNGDRQ